MNKREKYTTRLQLEAMVSLMKQNRDIACGFSQRAPAEVKKFWEELALTLNGSGPPLKDAGGWRKVWTDYKSSVKKKLSKNKQLLTGTGGGSFREIPLTEIEEEVSALLNLCTAVNGIPNVKNFGVLENPLLRKEAVSNPSEIDLNIEENVTAEEVDCTLETGNKEIIIDNNLFANVKSRPLKRSHKEEKAELLKEQIDIQKQLALDVASSLESIKNQNKENYRVMKDVKRAIYALADEKKKQAKILEQQLEEQKRHNAEMTKLLIKKNALKERILKLEIDKLNEQLQ